LPTTRSLPHPPGEFGNPVSGQLATVYSVLWTLAYGYHKDRTPTHGYEVTQG